LNDLRKNNTDLKEQEKENMKKMKKSEKIQIMNEKKSNIQQSSFFC